MGCLGWCPKLVKVVDGKAVSIKGNPESKATQGRLCARGMMGLQILYDPDRVKTPLKRTNPKKGINEDPKFVPISWDEAWSALVTRMKALREAGTPEKVVMLRGRYTQASSTYWYGTFARAYAHLILSITAPSVPTLPKSPDG
jgi:anaerobic selenocysteine-containing dehydrogenase